MRLYPNAHCPHVRRSFSEGELPIAQLLIAYCLLLIANCPSPFPHIKSFPKLLALILPNWEKKNYTYEN